MMMNFIVIATAVSLTVVAAIEERGTEDRHNETADHVDHEDQDHDDQEDHDDHDIACLDNDDNCPFWASSGHCTQLYASYMERNCKKSCNLCKREGENKIDIEN